MSCYIVYADRVALRPTISRGQSNQRGVLAGFYIAGVNVDVESVGDFGINEIAEYIEGSADVNRINPSVLIGLGHYSDF